MVFSPCVLPYGRDILVYVKFVGWCFSPCVLPYGSDILVYVNFVGWCFSHVFCHMAVIYLCMLRLLGGVFPPMWFAIWP